MQQHVLCCALSDRPKKRKKKTECVRGKINRQKERKRKIFETFNRSFLEQKRNP